MKRTGQKNYEKIEKLGPLDSRLHYNFSQLYLLRIKVVFIWNVIEF